MLNAGEDQQLIHPHSRHRHCGEMGKAQLGMTKTMCRLLQQMQSLRLPHTVEGRLVATVMVMREVLTRLQLQWR